MVIKKASTRSRRRSPRPELGVAMVGHAFMGRAHSNAFRQVNHFFDLPYRVVPRVVVGRDAARAEAARDKLGFAESSTDLDAVLARDYPIIQGLILFFSFVYILINLLIDLSYVLLDPRIRY